MRAGPLSDERVMRLVNRRFVPIYFDLDSAAPLGDPEAKKFLVAQRKAFGGTFSVPSTGIVVMSSQSEVLGEIPADASPDKVLETLLAILKKNPKYAKPSDQEQKVRDPIAKAEILIDLVDYAGARKILAKEKGDKPRYLLGRLARLDRDWKSMHAHFENVKDRAYADHLKMERAYELWYGKKFAKLRDHLADFAKTSPRYSESRYYLGLAHYHLGEKKTATKIWVNMIKGCSQDPWVYKADWACTGSSAFFAGSNDSPLKRAGYLGNSSPDLEKMK